MPLTLVISASTKIIIDLIISLLPELSVSKLVCVSEYVSWACEWEYVSWALPSGHVSLQYLWATMWLVPRLEYSLGTMSWDFGWEVTLLVNWLVKPWVDGSGCAWEIGWEGRLVEKWGLWSSENWLVERLVYVWEIEWEIGWEYASEYVWEIGWGDGWEIV